MTLISSASEGLLLPHIVTVIACLFMSRYFFKIAGKWILTFPSEISQETRRNVVDSVCYVCTLLFSVTFGEYISRGENWRLDYDHCFIGYPDKMIIPYELKVYYTFGIGFYIFSLICLFIDEKKKDFVAMAVHHCLTIFLILFSAMGNMHRIGAVIMISFDKSDILLEAAKICNRLKLHNSATSMFVMFVVSWINYRVYGYPLYVLSSVFRAEQLSNTLIPFYQYCVVFLSVIWLLQVYWSWFIIKKVITIWKKGVTAGEDPREDCFKEHQQNQKKEKAQ